jgi:hypothetical protein
LEVYAPAPSRGLAGSWLVLNVWGKSTLRLGNLYGWLSKLRASDSTSQAGKKTMKVLQADRKQILEVYFLGVR